MTFLLRKRKQELLRPLKVQALGRMPLYSTLPSFKEGKKASKLRIVFDASVKENGPSLMRFCAKDHN